MAAGMGGRAAIVAQHQGDEAAAKPLSGLSLHDAQDGAAFGPPTGHATQCEHIGAGAQTQTRTRTLTQLCCHAASCMHPQYAFLQERQDLQASLKAGVTTTSGPAAAAAGREQAVQALCTQLDLQLGRLEQAGRKKQAALQRCQGLLQQQERDAGAGAAGADGGPVRMTINDLIANEA